MSKFDYMNFDVGYSPIEFVVNAKKYKKEQVIELCVKENDWMFKKEYCNSRLLRIPEIEDVIERRVRWFPKVPDYCGYDGDVNSGCYTYCNKNVRGSFPVWVIRLDSLKKEETK